MATAVKVGQLPVSLTHFGLKKQKDIDIQEAFNRIKFNTLDCILICLFVEPIFHKNANGQPIRIRPACWGSYPTHFMLPIGYTSMLVSKKPSIANANPAIGVHHSVAVNASAS